MIHVLCTVILCVITHTCDISDFLLPLLLPFGSFAQIRSDEARQGLHTLLHVSRHTLLQRQGRHLTPDHQWKHTIGAIYRSTAAYKAYAALLQHWWRTCLARLHSKAITNGRGRDMRCAARSSDSSCFCCFWGTNTSQKTKGFNLTVQVTLTNVSQMPVRLRRCKEEGINRQ